MNPLPLTDETRQVIRRIVWFEPPEQAVQLPARLAAYAFTYATAHDMATLRKHWTDDDLREALDHAPPGIIDPRSWHYWHLMLDRYPPPPLTQRTFDQAAPPEARQ